MSEPEQTPGLPEEQTPVAPEQPSATPEQAKEPEAEAQAQPPRRRRLRRFLLRHLPLSLAGLLVLGAATLTGLYYWASSPGFENQVRRRLIADLEDATGGKATVANFHWRLLDLEAEAGGVVLHGTEDVGDAPLAKVERLRVRLSLLDLWSPRIVLNELEIERPQLHLIAYPDGSTNMPAPRRKRKSGRGGLETLFDLRLGRLAIENGVVDYEDRATGFDAQNHYEMLDLTASQMWLKMGWLAPSGGLPERYRVEAAASDVEVGRGGVRARPRLTVPANFSAALELMHSEARLERLSVAAAGRTLTLSGILQDFNRPRWTMTAKGEFDLRIAETVTGFPDAPEGVMSLDLNGAGQSGAFRVDGGMHIENGAYLGVGLNVRFAQLDTQLHLDRQRLQLTATTLRLHDGGTMQGTTDLSPWLPAPTGGVLVPRPARASVEAAGRDDRNLLRVHRIPPNIPMVGKVAAQFKNVTLDGLLDLVSPPNLRRLGLATLLNGPVEANWSGGETSTLTVGGKFDLSPQAVCPANEVPAMGVIDATYAHKNGSVDLRRFDLHTPSTQISASGTIGADPVTRPTQLNLSVYSRNLADLDPALRALGLERAGRKGAAALPATLKGQASFNGLWAGSLVDPRLSGTASATQFSMEIPPLDREKNPQSHWVYWDAAEVAGSYSAERIAIDRGLLRRGAINITLDGSLTAAQPLPGAEPAFDSNSLLRLHLNAHKVPVKDVQDLAGTSLPVTGLLEAKIDSTGTAGNMPAAGWVELDQGTVWDEPVAKLRALGTISAQQVKITSMNLTEEAGKASASGSYEFSSGRFTLEAHGAGIDAARIRWLRSQGADLTGKLSFQVNGHGTKDDPRLDGWATLAGLALEDESLGTLEMTAHTANRTASYELSTRLNAAEMSAHGETRLDGDYPTRVQLDFSRFNIGALIKLTHVKELSGESSLAGTVTLEGPMAKPDQMRGEAHIAELAATVSGVHLASQGGLHASLRNGLIQLDPLHVTGEQTDLRAQGSISLKGQQQLDFAANGSINLKVAETIDPDLTASGVSTFQMEAHGPLANPELRGRVDFRDGALALEDVPNGLSQIQGTLEFNRDRLEVRSLTAMSGGGLLNIGGFLAYHKGLYADLSVTGKGIRIRYPQGASSQADLALRFEGPSSSFLLSGDVLLTRFSLSQEFDLAALAAQAKAVQPAAAPDAPSNRIRLDVHIASSPQLSFQNAFAKLAGNVDLKVRGTLASPSLMGRVSITDGTATLAGTRYDLQRGEISFTNPVRIQPTIDLNATARVEDYDITLSLHGTAEKLTAAYRSDPPLPEADVLALLALGRTENQQRIYGQQQVQAGTNPATDALLGGALNATVSNRVQRLFGAGAVKVDPSYLGALGNSTSRITVEEQLGPYLTLTYATNTNTTAQQLLQADIAVNRHVSVQMSRDESGVFSVVLKATRRFR